MPPGLFHRGLHLLAVAVGALCAAATSFTLTSYFMPLPRAIIEKGPASKHAAIPLQPAELAPSASRQPLQTAKAPRLDHDAADLAAFQALGRPSVDAIWQGRMHLASPAEWAGNAVPARPKPPEPRQELAYAPAASPRVAGSDPFIVIDEADLARRRSEAAKKAPQLALSDKKTADQRSDEDEEDEDDEDDEDEVAPRLVPRPLPRPKILADKRDLAEAKADKPVIAAPQVKPVAASLAPAENAGKEQAPPRPALEVTQEHSPNFILQDEERQNPESGQRTIQLASLPQAPPPDARPAPTREPAIAPAVPALTLRTPFGIPYTLQQESVEASCFPPPLVDLIRKVGAHYGQTPIVTSGLRGRGRRGSLHRRCLAADIMIPGVSANELAKVARQIPGVGGVGQYCHPNLVHIDVGTARDWKQGCGGFFALREGTASHRASLTR